MARLYTPEQQQEVLQQLRIQPVEGKISGKEAARILSWRVKEEFGMEHEYTDASIRRHVQQKNLHVEAEKRKPRYDVGEVFLLTLAPKRGRQKQPSSQ